MNKKHGPWYDTEVEWSRNSDGHLEILTEHVTIVFPDGKDLKLANWILLTSGEIFK